VNRWAPPLLIVAAVVVTLAGMSGRFMPHEWFGITTSELLGWMILLAVPAVLVCMLLIVMDRQKQLRRGQSYMNRRLDDLAAPRRERRGRVVQGPWSGSGGSE
jgi:uncharacterized membrane protein